jgi:3-oxoacyl-[acyl-carrier protein] reductase
LADVRNSKEVEFLVSSVVRCFGSIDILVNAAGISHSCRVVDLPEEEWNAVIDINLKGTFLVSKACAKVMLSQGRGGRIINIGSGAGLSARIGTAPYSASKAGLIMLTKTLAMELGPNKITANVVSPGLFPAKDKIRPLRPEYVESYLKSIPLGYFGKPKDVAEAVLFLASSKAHYITGEVLTIDGGTLAGRFLLPENINQ